MRIDVHAHLSSSSYIEALRRAFGKDEAPAGKHGQRIIQWMNTDPRITNLETRLEEMEKYENVVPLPDLTVRVLLRYAPVAIAPDAVNAFPTSSLNWRPYVTRL